MERAHRDIAIEYLRRFGAGDIDGLAPLRAPQLRFTGPCLSCSSASAFLDALRRDRPQLGEPRILSLTQSEDAVAVFYEYEMAGRAMTIAQLFKISGKTIREMMLVFDTGIFERDNFWDKRRPWNTDRAAVIGRRHRDISRCSA